MKSIKQLLILGAVALIGVAGPVVGADFGGVLHWTQYVSALLIFGLVALVVPLAATREHSLSTRHLLSTTPFVLWVLYGWAQCLPLSHSVVASLSPGSASAYTDWLMPFLSNGEAMESFPVSIAADRSRHASAFLTIVLALFVATLIACRTTSHAIGLIAILAGGIGLHALYGVIGHLISDLNLGLTATRWGGFGTYINRNNLAYLFNLGLACCAAIFVARWSVGLGGRAFSERRFNATTLQLLSTDRLVWFSGIVGVICLSGLLVCGSRSGLLGTLVGGAFAFLWIRRGDGWIVIPTAIAVGGLFLLLMAFVVSPFSERLPSVEGFKEIDLRSGESLDSDPRLQHWPDGLRAAYAYLPAGAGIATYRYAYLPFQSPARSDWFHHADNLWLELLVEQGVPGALFLLAAFGVILLAMLRLATSPEPVDQGLATGCVFFLGATVWSEAFDFGLIVPANLISVAAFLGVVIARGQRRRNVSEREGERGWGTGTERVFVIAGVAVPLGITVSAAACLGTLRHDAATEQIARTIQASLDSGDQDAQSYAKMISLLDEQRTERQSPRLLDLASTLHRKLAREKLMDAKKGTGKEASAEARRATRPSVLIQQWRNDAGSFAPVPAEYLSAVELAKQSLRKMPLGVVSRDHLVALEFAHQDHQLSQAALAQLGELQQGSADTLAVLARLASASGEESVAASLWKRATRVAPAKTTLALRHARAEPNREIADYLDENFVTYRLASRTLLEAQERAASVDAQSQEFFRKAVEKLNCEDCQSNRERASCEKIQGGVLLRLGEVETSLKHFEEAIRHQPADIALRRDVISQLLTSGRRLEALSLAERAYEDLPEHYPFKRIAAEIKTEINAEVGAEPPQPK